MKDRLTQFFATLFFLYMFSSITLISQVNNYDNNEEDSEFAEPLFHDTSTDFGGEVGEIEINFSNGLEKLSDGKLLYSSLEVEYVVLENFGLEVEVPFLLSMPDVGTNISKIGTIELAAQYTFLLNENMAFAGGFEFGIPTSNNGNDKVYEVEPFLTFVYKMPLNLSFHASLSPGFEIGDEKEFELGYNGAILYTLDDMFFGAEFNGQFEEENILFISPQAGIEVGSFSFGLGIQLPVDKSVEHFDYNIMAKISYEFEVSD